MAHELESINGIAAFFSARQPAWHKLGIVTPMCLTADQALTMAQLDWEVTKQPLFASVTLTGEDVAHGSYGMSSDVADEGTHIALAVKDRFATVRNHPVLGHQVLGLVSDRYEVIQNAEAFAVLTDIVDQSGAIFETAGSLKDGKRVFMSMRMPDHILVGGIDRVDTYLLAYTSHDGSEALRLAVTPVRAVCQNTVNAALGAAVHTFNIRHTASARDRIATARQALGLTFKYVESIEQEFSAMLDKTWSDAQFELLTKQLLPMPVKATREQEWQVEMNRRGMQSIWTAPTQKTIAGTAWAAYNSVVEWADWYQPVRGKNKVMVRATRNLNGANDGLKQKAFDLINA